MRAASLSSILIVLLFAGTTAVGADGPNPEYEKWSEFKKGSTVSYELVHKDGEKTIFNHTLIAVTDEKVVIESFLRMPHLNYKGDPSTREIPARIEIDESKKIPNKRKFTSETSEEEIQIAGQKLSCTKVVEGMRADEAAGKPEFRATSWFSDSVPGQLVKMVVVIDGTLRQTQIVTAFTVAEAERRNRESKQFEYMGCFNDQGDPWGPDGRDLSGHKSKSSSQTVERCIATCREKGFPYAGVQYASHCFCGKNYGKSGKSNNCNMKCSGDSRQICGGTWANSVYRIN